MKKVNTSLIIHLTLSLSLLSGCRSPEPVGTTLDDVINDEVNRQQNTISMRDVFVSHICPARGGDEDQLELSVLLGGYNVSTSKTSLILPTNQLEGEEQIVGELISADNFVFSLPSVASTEAGEIDGVAYMTNDDEASVINPIAINPLDVSFDYVAGEDKQEAHPYVIFVLDQSASHIGQRVADDLQIPQATDFGDQRISFFTQVIKSLPRSYYASIISYKGNFDDALESDNLTSVPLSLSESTQYERSLGGTMEMVSGEELLLDRLKSFGNSTSLAVGTPMIRALKSALEIAQYAVDAPPTDKGLRPVVILYTDGVEDGDTSGSAESLSDIAALYAAAGIPINVMHLNLPFTFAPEERRRDAELAELACQTRGDYLFVQSDKTFSESRSLPDIIRNRIDGRWVLRVDSSFGDAATFPNEQGYLFNTALQVTLGDETKSYNVARSGGGDVSKDQRVWIYKD